MTRFDIIYLKGVVNVTTTTNVRGFTVAQTITRESLCCRILDLPDEEVRLVERYVSDLEGHEPNAKTIKAIEDSFNPANLVGPFSTVESLMDSLLTDDA